VSDWPGLAVTAFSDRTGAEPLQLLRLDRVAPTVLLAIFGGVAQQVRIAKPAQGLHFGVVEDGDDPSAYRIYLRGLGGAFPAGPQLPGDPSVVAQKRTDAAGRVVLDVAKSQSLVADAMTKAYGSTPVTVHPGAFGLQLVAGAELQVFVPDPQQVQARPPRAAPARPPAAGTVAALMKALGHATQA
jgi:hypothetical protein